MRICVICSGFSSVYGGIEAQMYELGKYWAMAGHEVSVISGLGKKQGPEGVTLFKLPFVTRRFFEFLYHGSEKPFYFFPFSFELEGLTIMPFVAPTLFGIRPNIVVCTTLAESLIPIALGFPCGMIGQADIACRYWAFKRVCLIHVYDQVSFRTLKSIGFDPVLIPNGVNMPDESSPSEIDPILDQYGIDRDSFILLTVARLVPQKRVNLIIDAVKSMPCKTTLLIVGDGSHLNDLRRQAEELNSPNNVIFLPPMSHEDVQNLYNICHVYSLPQEAQLGLSISELEALSHGKPIVAADTLLNRRMIRGFGLVANVKNPHEYANTLVQARSLRFDRESLRDYMKKLDWKYIADEYIREFDVAINRRARACC